MYANKTDFANDNISWYNFYFGRISKKKKKNKKREENKKKKKKKKDFTKGEENEKMKKGMLNIHQYLMVTNNIK